MLNRFKQHFCPDLGIDLGTANTVIAVNGHGVVLNEPSVLAIRKETGQVLGQGNAVGKLARQMLGRTPEGIVALQPLKHGVITDYRHCEAMLRYFLMKSRVGAYHRSPRVLIAVPGGITSVEKRAVFNSTQRAGAGRIFLIEKATAAAVGAGVPIAEPLAGMICDIGGGTTEVALFSLGSTIASQSLRIAGDDFDQAIVDYLRYNYSLKVGLQTAEALKRKIGSAYTLPNELSAEVSGMDIVSGIPRRAMVTSEEIREAIAAPINKIIESIKLVIEQCQPDLVADLAQTGITLTGGGAMLRSIDKRLKEQLGVHVTIDSSPLTTVARGTLICLEHFSQWKDVLTNELQTI